MFRSLPDWAREVLFLLVTLLIWCTWSLAPLLQNRPESFQAAGSIIVAWAIATWGADRAKRERLLATLERNAIVSALNAVEAKFELNMHLANNTANEHNLAYFKLLEILNLQDTKVKNQRLAIQTLQRSLDDTAPTIAARNKVAATVKKQNLANDQWNAMLDETQTRWIALLRRVELYFVVFGTLQWGYGNHWVTALHSTVNIR